MFTFVNGMIFVTVVSSVIVITMYCIVNAIMDKIASSKMKRYQDAKDFQEMFMNKCEHFKI